MGAITIDTSLWQIAQAIDHSLLHPTLTDQDILRGLEVAKKARIGAVCVKPYVVPIARKVLQKSTVKVCSVVGFPHGSSTINIKALEARDALACGADEIDMVVNIGKVLSEDWAYVTEEIDRINRIVKHAGGVLKVTFENDYLQPHHTIRLSSICSNLAVGFIQTSTGWGMTKRADGAYTCDGATVPLLRLMAAKVAPAVHIKAAGCIRTLDQLLTAMWAGAKRIGTSSTEKILEEAAARGIGLVPVKFLLPISADMLVDPR